MPDLESAFDAVPSFGRRAIAAHALDRPECLAAAVGLAMTRGISAADITAVIAAMPSARRGQLYLQAKRQEVNALHRGNAERAGFYTAIAALADRKQIPS